MKLWFVSMECAGIVEAGGVKNVTFSLAKEFSDLNHKVTLFLPVFKCNRWDEVKDVHPLDKEVEISMCGGTQKITYTLAKSIHGNFDIVFVNHPLMSDKEDIYCYTENEQIKNPLNVKGTGHKDGLFIDVLFQKAVCAYGSIVTRNEIPDIVHCQDASTAILPAFVEEDKHFKKTQSVVTIHNAGPFYHHQFSSVGEAAWYTNLPTPLLLKSLNQNNVEPFLIAYNVGANLTTVSEAYAKELVDPQNVAMTDGLSKIFASNKIEIKGIVNGFDYERYDPRNKAKSKLPFEFDPEKGDLDGKLKCRKFFIQNIVNTDNFNTEGIKKYGKLEVSSENTKEIFIAYHGRVTTQKGISVLTEAIPSILENFENVRFIIAGQGEHGLEHEIIELTIKYPGRITFMNGYNQAVVRLVTAVSDFIVLPSFFEPCGLEDYIAQAFGTVPVAHKTGGLNKIVDGKTGFLYKENTKGNLIAKLSEVIMVKNLKNTQINRMIKNGATKIQKEFLWKNIIQKKYLPYFKEILKKR